MSVANLNTLNFDVLINIARFLSMRDLIALSQTCRQAYLRSRESVAFWWHVLKEIKQAYLSKIGPWTSYSAIELREAVIRSLRALRAWNYADPLKATKIVTIYLPPRDSFGLNRIAIIPNTRWMIQLARRDVNIYDMNTGQQLGSFATVDNASTFLGDCRAVAPDECVLLIGNTRDCIATVYKLRLCDPDPQAVASSVLVEQTHTIIYNRRSSFPKLSGDGRMVASVDESSLKLHILENGRTLYWKHNSLRPRRFGFYRDLLLFYHCSSTAVSMAGIHIPSELEEGSNARKALNITTLELESSPTLMAPVEDIWSQPIKPINDVMWNQSSDDSIMALYLATETHIAQCCIQVSLRQLTLREATTSKAAQFYPDFSLQTPRGSDKTTKDARSPNIIDLIPLPRSAYRRSNTQHTIFDSISDSIPAFDIEWIHVLGVDQPGIIRRIELPREYRFIHELELTAFDEESGVMLFRKVEAMFVVWFACTTSRTTQCFFLSLHADHCTRKLLMSMIRSCPLSG